MLHAHIRKPTTSHHLGSSGLGSTFYVADPRGYDQEPDGSRLVVGHVPHECVRARDRKSKQGGLTGGLPVPLLWVGGV